MIVSSGPPLLCSLGFKKKKKLQQEDHELKKIDQGKRNSWVYGHVVLKS
jgi:hypothetical protein